MKAKQAEGIICLASHYCQKKKKKKRRGKEGRKEGRKKGRKISVKIGKGEQGMNANWVISQSCLPQEITRKD
jgi:hypothetical protein